MPSNSNVPGHTSHEPTGKPSSPVPGASAAGAANLPADSGRTHPDTQIAANAKAVGGGIEAGSTDFGPDTASKVGGNTSVGAGTSRSTGNTTTDSVTQGSPAAAGGNSVLATGRPTQGDSRAAIGGAALPTRDNPAVQDPAGYAVGQTTRQAADPSGVGAPAGGGGTAGTPATKPGPRSADITEGKTALTEGTRPGTGRPDLQAARGASPHTQDDISKGYAQNPA